MRNRFQFSLIACALAGVVGCSADVQQVASQAGPNALSFNDRNHNNKLDIYEDTSAPVTARADDLISRLTLEQKVKMVTGTGFSVSGVGGSEKVPGAAGSTFEIPELGIPAMVLTDGPAGVRIEPKRENDDATYYATAFPIATLLASSWDKTLVAEVGAAMGEEVKEYGADIFLAPGMNIHYNPLGGRNFEYYSEDPYLSGNLAASIVNGIESNGVGATIKHFVTNSAETSRMWMDAHVNERAYRELYLRGFEIAVKESQPWAIMTSYNKVNGTYTSQDEVLLTDVLRGEWGFEGLVMTDWFAGDSAPAQMQAGNDLIMPGMPDQRQAIIDAVKNGTLDESTLDRNLRKIFTVMFASPSFNHYDYSDKPDLKGHAEVARQAAAEGVVLLKNKGDALPLTGSQTVAAFGNTSYEFIAGGTGSGDVNEAYTVSLVQGLENSPLKVERSLQKSYDAFMAAEKAKQPEKKNFFDLLPPLPEFEPSEAMVAKLANSTDVALITLGRNAGEFQDRGVEGDFDLTDAEQSLITKVSKAFHAKGKKVVVALNIGNVIETASWRDKVDAIVLPWQGGQEAGNALVDVLTGKVNPSGKLATTFPMSYSDVASSDSFPGFNVSDEEVTDPYIGLFVGHHSQLNYEDGVYVGYRYYDAFNIAPAYPFGYGLSYSSFNYSDLQVTSNDGNGNVTLSATISNQGDAAGKEVVQLYVSAPKGSLAKPVKELKGFTKTAALRPGQSETVTFTLTPKLLASFNPAQRAWVADAGEYTLMLGASSADIRATATINLATPVVADKVSVTLNPSPKVKEITAQ
ncbi:glycoside hydrolase family 3 C-terminal domain-containing protein [Alteromonas confluentis]|uniref:Beta-D-glucoside glucohydrolase n=1 Tax=Alteromonas confluentis TaxID=1656094 RepID=A0A1E7ZBQ3_9ALTE|nr:glycoside hydrolase family 3 C-terminal domain-containing protein [Alteromonas confluentis]OFC70930.1 glycosyl hydrolase [Alteromonas confluentis]